jgi:hypothetical protein
LVSIVNVRTGWAMLGPVTAWEASLGHVGTDSARFGQVKPCYVRLSQVSSC